MSCLLVCSSVTFKLKKKKDFFSPHKTVSNKWGWLKRGRKWGAEAVCSLPGSLPHFPGNLWWSTYKPQGSECHLKPMLCLEHLVKWLSFSVFTWFGYLLIMIFLKCDLKMVKKFLEQWLRTFYFIHNFLYFSQSESNN